MGGEELVVACVDNIWAKLDCEGEAEKWSRSWKHVW